MKQQALRHVQRMNQARLLSPEDAAGLLNRAHITDAVCVGQAILPDFGVAVTQLDAARRLYFHKESFGALIADGAAAAAASRYMSYLRRKHPAEEIPLAADEAEEPALVVPERKEMQFIKRPAFVLVLDDMAAVPALDDLPGEQPDLIVALPALMCASDAQIREALMRSIGVAVDTIAARNMTADAAKAFQATYTAAMDAYRSQHATAQQAAEWLLDRGHEGGAVFRLGAALAEACRMTVGEGMMAVLPVLAPRFEAMKTMDVDLPCEPAPSLMLADIPLIARKAAKTAYAMQPALTEKDFDGMLRRLYVYREEAIPVEELVAMQEAFFRTGKTLDVDFRLRQLKLLGEWMDAHEAEIEAALQADLGKCAFEAFETEIMLVHSELRTMRRHLPLWQADRIGLASPVHFPSAARRVRNPHGRVLIMSPWNYPFLLTMDPLIGSIAGGNCTILKPSAYAPATSRLFAEMAHDLFDPAYVAVVEGGRAQNQSLLAQKFDHIFFTGSVEVGKLVMKSAAEHLTPVVLELGGKSPCIVDETADIALAARRITWGKYLNAGQTCVAPDYVLCHPSVADEFIMEVEKNIRKLYGMEPVDNAELCRIVNERHFDRLNGLMEGAEIAVGGASARETLKIEPTVLKNVTWDDPVMREEIFGPIMPVMLWDGDFDDIIAQIEARPRPLAAYLFTTNRERKKQFLSRLRFGGGCINDVIVHLANESLPFGGVGESGMGAYHGKYSFNTFTHEKGVLIKSNRMDISTRYAPYNGKIRLLRFLSKII